MKSLCLTVAFLVAATSAAAAQDLDGKALYVKNCQKCHGANGTPSAAMAKMNPTMKPLTTELLTKTDEDYVKLLANGSENGKKKPMKDKMTPEEMTAVIKYVREMVKGG